MPLKKFTDYLLLEKKYSALTVKAYQTDLEGFMGFVKNEFDEDAIYQVNYSQIRSWIVSLVEKKVSNRSINRKVSALNTYFKFLQKVGDIKLNPLTKHKALKTSKKIQIPFSEAEINTAIDDLYYEENFEGIRDKLIIELFYATRIRRIELNDWK